MVGAGVQPISLEPCPYYFVEISGTGEAASKLLNCVPRPAIEPAETVRFEMRLDVPPDRQPGDGLVVWRIIDTAPDTPVVATATVQVTPPARATDTSSPAAPERTCHGPARQVDQ